MAQGPLSRLYKQLQSGEISRRDFIQAASALGFGAAMGTFLANAHQVAASGGSKNGYAVYANQDGTGAPPSVGTENQTRGEGGELRIIQWQAATNANTHQSTGTKDFLIGTMVQEPLLHYLPDGSIIPCLAQEVPSVENGLLAEDLTSATFNLLPDIVWSDGTPLTSRDVQFTWEWVVNVDNAAVYFNLWDTIESVDTPDELTVVFNFKAPSASWFEPLTGGTYGNILPAHAFNDEPVAANNEDFFLVPIGTGPYVITEFVPNDRVLLTANENYREANKPFYATVNVKGGGDAASAGRAVLQTGDYDYAWNLQVEPAILYDMAGISALGEVGENATGVLVSIVGPSMERIHINFSDPDTEVDGERSHADVPHPFLRDPAVRQAMNKAVHRQLITDEFYGLAARPTANILSGIESLESPNTSWEFDLEEAAQILDDAGWEMNGDVREKDGVQLEVSYATSINQPRQKTQAVVKQAFERLGIKSNLEQIDAGTFFGAGGGNELNINHFYWDIAMWTNSPGSTVPVAFFLPWYAGENNVNFAMRSNGWTGQNRQKYQNPEFDSVYEAAQVATSIEEAAELLIQLNDILINDVVIIPEVNRPADTYAIGRDLIDENVALSAFEQNYWNVANWRTHPA